MHRRAACELVKRAHFKAPSQHRPGTPLRALRPSRRVSHMRRITTPSRDLISEFPQEMAASQALPRDFKDAVVAECSERITHAINLRLDALSAQLLERQATGILALQPALSEEARVASNGLQPTNAGWSLTHTAAFPHHACFTARRGLHAQATTGTQGAGGGRGPRAYAEWCPSTFGAAHGVVFCSSQCHTRRWPHAASR